VSVVGGEVVDPGVQPTAIPGVIGFDGQGSHDEPDSRDRIRGTDRAAPVIRDCFHPRSGARPQYFPVRGAGYVPCGPDSRLEQLVLSISNSTSASTLLSLSLPKLFSCAILSAGLVSGHGTVQRRRGRWWRGRLLPLILRGPALLLAAWHASVYRTPPGAVPSAHNPATTFTRADMGARAYDRAFALIALNSA
jgi:hypothetical protein